THARRFGHQLVDHQPHHHAAGVPAAGDHALEDRGFGSVAVDVEGLRVELFGEGDDLFLADGAAAERDLLARIKVFEIPVGRLHAAASSPNPGCAMKRRRWWSESPRVSS